MQSKIYYTYKADGEWEKRDGNNAKLYQGQVAATTYYLTVTEESGENWLPTDRVYIVFSRPENPLSSVERRMDYDDVNKWWYIVSDGWETDVDIADNVDSVPLNVSFVARRYSTTGNPVLIKTRTTGCYTETIYKSGTFYPQEIQESTVVEYIESKIDEHSERLDTIDGQIVDLDERIAIAEGAAAVDTVTGEADDLVNNTDPKNPIIMHDITKANLVVGATVDNLAKLTSSGDLADSGKSIADLALKTDITDNLTSTATDKPLSANQGNALKALIDNKEDSLGFTPENSVNKNTAYGYCPLDSVAKVPLANLPTIPTKDSNLTNDRYVRYDSDGQGLTDTQKANARSNIGAGDSGFSGNYNDLANKPDLKTHATTAPSTVQSNSTTTVPSDKLLKESTFSRIYRSLSEVGGITPSTVTPVELAAAMAQGSILIDEIIQSDAPMLYPSVLTTTAGGLFVRKAGNNAVLFEFNVKIPESTKTYQYTGIVRLSDTGTYQWSNWVRDTWGEAITIGIEATDLNTLIEDGGKWRATTTALAANCSNKPESSPNGFVLECVDMRRSDSPYRTKMQTYRSNNGIWYRIGSQATSADVVTWNDWANIIASTGAQTIGGAKTFTDNVTVSNATPEILLKSTTDVYNVTAPFLATGLKCTDKNGQYTGAFRTYRSSDGSTSVNMTARNQANALMTVGLRGFTDGTWALWQGDTPGIVDIGSASSRFKDLYLAGNINAAGTITGNVVNSPYKLITSGTLAANASLTLNSLILGNNLNGRRLYLRIYGDDISGGQFRLNSNRGTHLVRNIFSETYSRIDKTADDTEYEIYNTFSEGELIEFYFLTGVIAEQQISVIQGTQSSMNIVNGMLIDYQAISLQTTEGQIPTLTFYNADTNNPLNYQLYSANY